MEFKENLYLRSDFYSFINLLEEGKLLETIERYYDEDIIQIENTDAPVFGKIRLKLNEESNLQNVNSVKVKVKDFVIDEKKELVWGEMIIKFSNKLDQRKILTEAFKQSWKNRKIVRQHFFYNKINDGE